MALSIVFAVAAVTCLLVFPYVIRQLRRARMGQLIREEGPAAHLSKAGTPTAGGIVFLLVGLVLFVAADRASVGALVLLALLLGGALGFADDYAAIRGNRNLGLKARQKILAQLLIGAVLGYLAYRWNLSRQLVPFDGWREIGVWMVPIGALAFAAGSNAFNLTDGSDGLAGGAGAIAFGSVALIAVLQQRPWPAASPASFSTMPSRRASSWATPAALPSVLRSSRPRLEPGSSGTCPYSHWFS
jgi:phospho-N-acetylmuramoyl-pentapeptide-transferase